MSLNNSTAPEQNSLHSNQPPIFLVLGKIYHELQRPNDFEVQLVQYEPLNQVSGQDDESKLADYHPIILSHGEARAHVSRGRQPVDSDRPLRYGQVASFASIPPVTSRAIADWPALDEYILGLARTVDKAAIFKIRLVAKNKSVSCQLFKKNNIIEINFMIITASTVILKTNFIPRLNSYMKASIT